MDNSHKRGFWRTTGEYLGFVNPTPQEIREVNGGPSPGVIPPARSNYGYITPELALNIGAVYRAISIITASVSQMELGVFRNGVEIPTPALVRQPDMDDSITGFIEETVFSLAAYGNAYWRVYGNPVASIKVLDPNAVTVTTHETTGKKVYFVDGKEVPSNRIKHLKLMRKPGHLEGYGPIQAGQSELSAALKLRQFADGWFGQSGVPVGVLTTDQTLGPEEAKAFAEAWGEFVNNNGTAILSQGMHYELLNLKPADAQYLEIQKEHTVAIARLFGVPAMHMLAEVMASNTYLNLEQAQIVFLQTTLVRYMTEIEEALSDLLPRGQRVQFKEDGLLRMDSVTKWDVIGKQVEVGYTSGDELRKNEGKSPLPKPEAPATSPAPVGKETTPKENEDD